MSTLAEVMLIFEGSNGDATKALYARLASLGPRGVVAAFLMRAQKNSTRAKVYRGGPARGGGSWRGMAYERKQWAIDKLVEALEQHAAELGLAWGWGDDPAQEYHRAVLYVELPQGQVSFHTASRGRGPDAPCQWDGVRGASPSRICAFAAAVLDGERSVPTPETQAGRGFAG